MHNYEFIGLAALCLGVISILVMMEVRRRAQSAQFAQLHETLTACRESLQAIQSGNGQLHETLTSCHGWLQEIGSTNEALSQLQTAVEKAVVRFESALLQHLKAQDAASQSIAKQLSDVTQSTSKQLLAEVQRTTKATQDLKESLVASVEFNQ